jgi:hypothetical protein
MVYPTPGFIVRQTFLEFEEEGEVEEPAPLTRRERSYSDTELTVRQTSASQFGSEELRLYCEMRKADSPSDETALHAIHEKLSQMFFSVSAETDSIHEKVCQMSSALANETHAIHEEVSEIPPQEDAGSLDMDMAQTERSEPTSFSSSCDESLADTPLDQCTTLMLSGLPPEYTRLKIVQTLCQEGFVHMYDFVFVPMDLRTRTGNGFALVNFRSNSDACRALVHFDGFTRWSVEGSQACEASWSKFLQGTEALIERHRNSPIMHEAVPDVYKPAMYDSSGNEVAFPEPTKRIRMPRLRRKSNYHNNASLECAPSSHGSCGTTVAERNTISARQASGRERRQKAKVTSYIDDINNDAWFVDLVASRLHSQAMAYERVAPPLYCSKVDNALYGNPEMMGLGGYDPFAFGPAPGQLVWLMSN